MSHKNLVAVVVCHDGQVLVGKHADGPFKGKWGVPSIDASVDRRPSRVAGRLAESSVLGMLGTRNTVSLQKLEPSALGLQVYELSTSLSELPTVLERTCAFLVSCFPSGTSMPTGLVPWTGCKWMSNQSDGLLDPISMDAFVTWKSQRQ